VAGAGAGCNIYSFPKKTFNEIRFRVRVFEMILTSLKFMQSSESLTVKSEN
jgi:hypothetical protein